MSQRAARWVPRPGWPTCVQIAVLGIEGARAQAEVAGWPFATLTAQDSWHSLLGHIAGQLIELRRASLMPRRCCSLHDERTSHAEAEGPESKARQLPAGHEPDGRLLVGRCKHLDCCIA